MNCPICLTNKLWDGREACIDCVMTGRLFDFYLTSPVRSNLLTEIRELPSVVTANLWPSVPGNWQLGIVLDDDRVVIAGSSMEVKAEEGIPGDFAAIGAAVPPVGKAWRFFVAAPRSFGGVSFTVVDMSEELDDEELVSALALI